MKDRYKDSPTMKRDEEDGVMKSTKKKKEPAAEKASSEFSAQTDGIEQHAEGIPVAARHGIERREMHNRHETEHMIADHSKEDKHDMHGRHEDEMKAMHKRHEKELTKGSGAGAEKINKVEEGSK